MRDAATQARAVGSYRSADEDPKPAVSVVRDKGRNLAIRGVIAALQDLGFIIERANEPLGLVTAARFAEPNYYDVVSITVTVRQDGEERMMIRANAIYNNRPIEDPKVYQNFFASL